MSFHPTSERRTGNLSTQINQQTRAFTNATAQFGITQHTRSTDTRICCRAACATPTVDSVDRCNGRMVFAHIPFRRRRHRQCAGPCFAAQRRTSVAASATIQSSSESAATEHSKAKKAKLSHCAAAPDSTAAMHVLPHDVLSSPSSRLRTSWAGSHARHVPQRRESHDSRLPRLLLAQSWLLRWPTLTSADRPSRLLRFDWRSVSDDRSGPKHRMHSNEQQLHCF